MRNSIALLGFLSAVALVSSLSGCSSKKEAETLASDVQSVTESSQPESEAGTAGNTSQAETTANALDRTNGTDYYKTLFSDRDKNPDYEAAEEIILGETVQSDSSGVTVEENTVTITREGIYRVSGTLSNGQIVVDAHNAKVQLILDGADISSADSSAIYARDCDKLFLTLAPGSVSNLSDGSSFVYDDETAQEPDACVFSKDSLVINGEGTLNITGNFADGIHSKDDVVITGGTVNVTSRCDGIKGKDYTAVCGGDIHIISGEDGIKSTETDDASLGFIYFSGGNVEINAQQDGIQAETDVVIEGGDFAVTSGSGSENSDKSHNDLDFGGGFGGKFDGDMTPPDGFGEGSTPPDGFGEGMTPPDGFGESNTPPDKPKTDTDTAADTSETSAVSKKGIKGGTSVNISGGNFVIDSSDDALHSNGTVSVSGGDFAVSSGDDGIHGSSAVNISGGNINIDKSYEGIEGASIDISGGIVSITSTDDGINASDGTAQVGLGTYSEAVKLTISGSAVLHVNAQGDGLDSNGSIEINGGEIVIDGPTNGGNGALDGNGELLVNGGTLIAAGSSQMAEIPDSNSAQNVISITFDSAMSAGTNVQIKNGGGEVIAEFTSEKTFENIVFSSPDLEKGSKYTFFLDGSENESFTVDTVVTTIGRQASAGGGGFGGGHGQDFQPATNENGEPAFPDGDFPHGGNRGDKQKPDSDL